jgi:hypothetical protein
MAINYGKLHLYAESEASPCGLWKTPIKSSDTGQNSGGDEQESGQKLTEQQCAVQGVVRRLENLWTAGLLTDLVLCAVDDVAQ